MTSTVRTVPSAALRIDTQAARLVRPAAPARPAPRPRSAVPYEHQVLFQEPAYTDGQPYAALDDDLEDEDG